MEHPREQFKPQYTHDCPECQFIGRYEYNFNDETNSWDLYFHEEDPVTGEEFLIARFSSEPSENISVPAYFAVKYPTDHPISMALRRAQELGLLKQQEQEQK